MKKVFIYILIEDEIELSDSDVDKKDNKDELNLDDLSDDSELNLSDDE